jgi:hypothetical protein
MRSRFLSHCLRGAFPGGSVDAATKPLRDRIRREFREHLHEAGPQIHGNRLALLEHIRKYEEKLCDAVRVLLERMPSLQWIWLLRHLGLFRAVKDANHSWLTQVVAESLVWTYAPSSQYLKLNDLYQWAPSASAFEAAVSLLCYSFILCEIRGYGVNISLAPSYSIENGLITIPDNDLGAMAARSTAMSEETGPLALQGLASVAATRRDFSRILLWHVRPRLSIDAPPAPTSTPVEKAANYVSVRLHGEDVFALRRHCMSTLALSSHQSAALLFGIYCTVGLFAQERVKAEFLMTGSLWDGWSSVVGDCLKLQKGWRNDIITLVGPVPYDWIRDEVDLQERLLSITVVDPVGGSAPVAVTGADFTWYDCTSASMYLIKSLVEIDEPTESRIANCRGDLFEKQVREIVRHFTEAPAPIPPKPALRYMGQDISDIDACLKMADGSLMILSCKSIIMRPGILKISHRDTRNVAQRVYGYHQELAKTIDFLSKNRRGDNYDLAKYKDVHGAVITPFPVMSPNLGETYPETVPGLGSVTHVDLLVRWLRKETGRDPGPIWPQCPSE